MTKKELEAAGYRFFKSKVGRRHIRVLIAYGFTDNVVYRGYGRSEPTLWNEGLEQATVDFVSRRLA